jgi:hypothetical protein
MFKTVDRWMKPLAQRLHANHMQRLGIRNTMRIASAYNGLKFARSGSYRRRQFESNFEELIRENGPPTATPITMQDGWVLDSSMKLPHLDRLLADSEKIIQEYGLVRMKEAGAYRTFFQNILKPEDLTTYPSILDFGLSSDVLSTVSRELGSIPVLSGTLPPGVRLAESNAAYDDKPGTHRDSQLYHIDYYALPMVYVIVLLRDVTMQSGPFFWLGVEESDKAAAALNYWAKGKPYRVSDEEFYSVVDKKAVHALTYSKGTVLFINSTRCFHYGSRDAVVPRFLMMYGFSTARRTDLSELVMTSMQYPARPGDSRLRRMVLDKEFVG